MPLGAFLSSGVDSSTIVALTQAQSARPIQTFSIAFHEAAYNEAYHAEAVTEYLRTAHTGLYVSPAEAMQVIPRLPSLYDELFSDWSQIPTSLESELTRWQVPVALSSWLNGPREEQAEFLLDENRLLEQASLIPIPYVNDGVNISPAHPTGTITSGIQSCLRHGKNISGRPVAVGLKHFRGLREVFICFPRQENYS